MVAELILIRHGEIDANVQRLWHGTTDSELNQLGQRQADALGQKIHDKYPDITKVYCSPLKRTLNTAKAVAVGLGQVPELCPDLIEYGIGEFEGTSYEDLQKHGFFTEIAFQSLVASHPEERIALVGHGAAFGILLASLLDGNPFPFFERHLSNTGIAHLQVSDSIGLLSFDDTDHLEGL